ncbi:xylulokinase [Croceiramulus getboli]|nr:FGGY family carbohydrate kinase [Flavobacteriaceae bacterium YJPT1-3]
MYYLGYDIGSSSVKVALVSAETGESLGALHEPPGEMEIHSPQPGWAEQDPELWWELVCKATKRILNESGISSEQISAIGIAYQMHGLVVVDPDGQPLRPAIIWCDSRAVSIGNQALNDLGQDYCRDHLLNAPGNFTASKLKWVQQHEPAIYARIHHYMLPGDYIAYRLTGQYSTTRNGLSEGTLWDYKQNQIATELLDYYGINTMLTPPLVNNFEDQGTVHQQAAEASGLPAGIPVRYRSGDQPNNALSLNILKPGEVAITGGTSGVIYAVSDHLQPQEISKVNQFAHVNHTPDQQMIGRLLNINGAGIQYRWLKKTFQVESYAVMNEEAARIPVGSDGLITLPFGNGAERMFSNRRLGSQWANLDFNRHHQGHLCRSALEGIAFAFVYGMELLKKDQTQIAVIRTGNDNLFRSSLFAETVATLIGHDIEIYNTTGAVGAARAAGITNGDFDAFSDQISRNDLVTTVRPLAQKKPYQEAYARWKICLSKHLNT